MTFNSSILENGFTILTFNMPNIKSVAINLIVNVGSRYENSSEIGISHFLEHMAFKGTLTRSSKDIAEQFDSIGGQFNAYTSREHTVYYAKVLENNFYKALEILSDIIQNSLFSKDDIEKEFKIILQEIAGVYDNPEELVFEKLYNTAYSNQPFGRSILGSENTINKFDNASFKSYLNKHYNAKNMYLSIAGNVDHDLVVKYVSELFLSLNTNEGTSFESAKYTGGQSYIKKDLEQTTMCLGFESVPYVNLIEFYHAQILSIVLGGGISSRLFQNIREDLALAYSVGAYNSSYYDSGLFCIYASTSNEKLKLLSSGLAKEINNIRDSVSVLELIRAKEQIKSSIYMAEEKSDYKSEEIGRNFAIFNRYYETEGIIEQIMEITALDITNIAKKIFSTKSTLSIIGPKPKDFDCSFCEGN